MFIRKSISGLILVITCCHPFYAQVDAAAIEQRDRIVLKHIRSLFEVSDSEIPPQSVRSLISFLRFIPTEHYDELSKVNIGRFHQAPRGQTTVTEREIFLNIDNIMTEEEFVAVFIHELGHIVDLGYLESSETQATDFQTISWKTKRELKSSAEKLDFVSEYAMTNAWEDFAESYAMYVIRGKSFDHWRRHNTALNRKFNFLKHQVFDQMNFLAADTHPVLKQDERGWDATLNTFNLNQLLLMMNQHKEEREIASRTRYRASARYQRQS